jgi:hypothetical protein
MPVSQPDARIRKKIGPEYHYIEGRSDPDENNPRHDLAPQFLPYVIISQMQMVTMDVINVPRSIIWIPTISVIRVIQTIQCIVKRIDVTLIKRISVMNVPQDIILYMKMKKQTKDLLNVKHVPQIIVINVINGQENV